MFVDSEIIIGNDSELINLIDLLQNLNYNIIMSNSMLIMDEVKDASKESDYIIKVIKDYIINKNAGELE